MVRTDKADPDEELVARVTKALRAASDQIGPGIDVSASGGAVQLWGTVRTRSERRKAAEIAMATPGVTSVDNQIVVLKGS